MLAKVVLNRLSAQEGRMMMIATYEPHSLGAKRLTPARMQASMMFFWTVTARSWSEGEMKDRTVCVPRSNSTRSETEE
jgi:hypothetical protein